LAADRADMIVIEDVRVLPSKLTPAFGKSILFRPVQFQLVVQQTILARATSDIDCNGNLRHRILEASNENRTGPINFRQEFLNFTCDIDPR